MAGSYLQQLLDLSARAYTLGEVIEKFWRDPAFPIIPNDTIARRAVFDALRTATGGVAWELVTVGGDPLNVRTPEELAINSHDQLLRVAQPSTTEAETTDGPDARGGGTETGSAGGNTSGAPGATPTGGGPAGAGPVEYRVHSLKLPPKSLTDPAVRSDLYKLLVKLADAFDDTTGVDLQMASLAIELNAASGDLDGVKERAEAAGVSWDETADDF
jgi:hypothetical protein